MPDAPSGRGSQRQHEQQNQWIPPTPIQLKREVDDEACAQRKGKQYAKAEASDTSHVEYRSDECVHATFVGLYQGRTRSAQFRAGVGRVALVRLGANMALAVDAVPHLRGTIRASLSQTVKEAPVAAKKTIEEGLSILRSIARSDAFKEMRGRIRDGASRVADNDRVPRVIAGSAGIVAALLSDEELDEPVMEGLDALDEESDMAVPHGDDLVELRTEADDEDEELDSVATIRDLEDAAPFDELPEDDDVADADIEDDKLPKFARDEEDEGAQEERADREVETKPVERVKRASTKPKPRARKPPKRPSKSANAAKGAVKKAASKTSAQAKQTEEPAPAKVEPEPAQPKNPSKPQPNKRQPAKRQPTAKARTRTKKSS